MPPEVAVPIRNALWEDDVLREAFISENPASLSPDDLALIDNWKHRVAGDFFILRHLKKHTIFIDDRSPTHGYGVQGITDSLQEIVGPYLPIYVKTVLIPFEDRIIYDSLLSYYPIHFGSGYQSCLNDTYREIQERGGIITELSPSNDSSNNQERIRSSNKLVLTAFQKALGRIRIKPKHDPRAYQQYRRFRQ